jgi:hypothetical protein
MQIMREDTAVEGGIVPFFDLLLFCLAMRKLSKFGQENWANL